MSSGIIRWGGWAGMVVTLTYVLAGILILIASLQRVFSSISEHLIEVILVVAFAATLVAIAGLHALQRRGATGDWERQAPR
jgi:Co/Zn/Cd efflux system component